MRAIVFSAYGGPEVLAETEVTTPVAGEGRVLVRVRAASVNRSDWEAMTARPAYVRMSGSGLRKPKRRSILGSDVAGVVEAVGAGVTGFAEGDEVFGDLLWSGPGTFAEFANPPEGAPLAIKPPELSFEEAAAIPQAGGLAWQAMTEGESVQAGEEVLVVGAGGGAGSFAVQIGRRFGAVVTGVDRAEKLEFMLGLGADRVVDFAAEDFAKQRGRFHRIVDFVGRRSLFANRRALRKDGRYLMVGGSVPRLIQTVTVGSITSWATSRHMRLMMATPKREQLERLAELVAAKEIGVAIDRSYDIGDVGAAMTHFGTDQVLGKLVITVP